jgi:uncharacterized lipoprotein YajG
MVVKIKSQVESYKQITIGHIMKRIALIIALLILTSCTSQLTIIDKLQKLLETNEVVKISSTMYIARKPDRSIWLAEFSEISGLKTAMILTPKEPVIDYSKRPYPKFAIPEAEDK